MNPEPHHHDRMIEQHDRREVKSMCRATETIPVRLCNPTSRRGFWCRPQVILLAPHSQ